MGRTTRLVLVVVVRVVSVAVVEASASSSATITESWVSSSGSTLDWGSAWSCYVQSLESTIVLLHNVEFDWLTVLNRES